MSGNRKKEQCPYNEWVYCRDKTCDYCGWNPEGRKKRETAPKEEETGRKLQKNNSTGHTGVYWDKRRQKWKAEIRKDGKRHHLGCFNIFEDAVNARMEAGKEKLSNEK